MKRILTATILATLPTVTAAEPARVPSQGTVSETVERLRTAVEDAGGHVFGVFDFGGGVRSVGGDVGEVQLMIFGDPEIGLQALSADRMAALDLPGKVLVYDTAQGSEMAYQRPHEMLAEWDIPDDAPVLDRIARTLDMVTSMAVK